MRLHELIENRLPFQHAKEFIQDIECSQKRIASMASQYPWLVAACQDAARTKLGDEFSVFRVITIPSNTTMRPETIVSTSLDCRIPHSIADGAPGYNLSTGQTFDNILLHYRIKAENVIIWVDHAMQYVRQAIGKRTNYRIEDRYGELIKIEKVLAWLDMHPEQEIIADVSHIIPSMLRFQPTHDDRNRFYGLRDWLNGRATPNDQEYQTFMGK